MQKRLQFCIFAESLLVTFCALAARVQVTNNLGRGLRLPIPSPEDLPGAEKVFPGLDRYIALLKRCWAQEPAARPTFGEIVTELR